MPRRNLTLKVLRALVAAFEAGATRDEAARRARVSRPSVYNWIRRGQQETSGLYHDLAEAAEIDRLALRAIRRKAGRGRRGRYGG